MELRKKRALEWIIFSILGIALILGGSLFVYQNAYAGKIYKNVTIAGVDVSGKTKKQAETLVKKKFDSIAAKDIIFSAGTKSVTAKVSDTGIGFNVSDSVSQAYAIGRAQHFFPQLYASAETTLKKIKVPVAIKIDQTKLNLFISQKLPGLNFDPVNAALSISNGQVVITNESNGQQVNTSNLAADLSKLVSSGSQSYKIQLQAISTAPQVTSTSLEALKSQAETWVNTKITLTYENRTYTPSQSDISSWITLGATDGGKQSVALDDAAIKTYLSKIAKDFEVQKKDRKINSLDNSVLQEGQQGKYLDKNKACKDIKLAFNQPTTIVLATYTEDPKEIKVYPAEGIVPDKYPGKYVDVDLSQQRLCRIENNNVIDCFTVSTGKASTPTPTGTRYIDSKEAKRWSAPYGLWMPWWQSMGGGYGIHELPEWPSGYKEGESHLGTPVSHGCVRLGVGPAQTVYDWTEIGTPVYIHK